MKTETRFLSILLVLGSLLLSLPAMASSVIYNNGPYNGTVDAWTINFGYSVSDTFYLPSRTRLTGVDFVAWEYPGDQVLTVDWQIRTGGASAGGPPVSFSGTASVTDIIIPGFGVQLDKISFSLPNLDLNKGTYWLTLSNAVEKNGDPVYWDENSGVGCTSPGCPSQATENSLGSIPSETFEVWGNKLDGSDKLSPGQAPEPSSIMLFGSGILGLAGILRHRLKD